jgi:PPE-repeat protein
MDCGAFSPEINSGRMHTGLGCGSLLVAPAAWDGPGRRRAFYGALLSSVISAGPREHGWVRRGDDDGIVDVALSGHHRLAPE